MTNDVLYIGTIWHHKPDWSPSRRLSPWYGWRSSWTWAFANGKICHSLGHTMRQQYDLILKERLQLTIAIILIYICDTLCVYLCYLYLFMLIWFLQKFCPYPPIPKFIKSHSSSAIWLTSGLVSDLKTITWEHRKLVGLWIFQCLKRYPQKASAWTMFLNWQSVTIKGLKKLANVNAESSDILIRVQDCCISVILIWIFLVCPWATPYDTLDSLCLRNAIGIHRPRIPSAPSTALQLLTLLELLDGSESPVVP